MSKPVKDFTDYHQHSWNVFTSPPSSKTLHLIATPFVVVFSLAISNFTDHFYYPFSGVDAQIAFIATLLFSLATFISLQFIGVHLIHLHGPHLQTFTLSNDGFKLNRAHIRFLQINTSRLKTVLDSHSMPNKSSWTTTPAPTPLLLNLPLNQGSRTIKIKFNRELDRQKIIQSLRHYLKLNP